MCVCLVGRARLWGDFPSHYMAIALISLALSALVHGTPPGAVAERYHAAKERTKWGGVGGPLEAGSRALRRGHGRVRHVALRVTAVN